MELRTEVRPRFDYARHAAAVRRPTDGDAIELVYEDVCLRLRATVGLQAGEDHATATFSLADGAGAAFILNFGGSGHSDASVLDPHGAVTSFEQTVRFWRDWLAQGSYSRTLARDGSAISADSEASHPPTVRRDPRRSHRQPPRAHRR